LIILDSSYLVSLYVPEDINNPKALEILRQNTKEDMILPDLILFETLTVLAGKRGQAFARETYSDMMANQKIRLRSIEEDEKYEILELFFNAPKKISFEDAIVIYLAKKTESNALSFDKEILRQILAGKKNGDASGRKEN